MYDGPIIDGHTHPMLGIGDQMVAKPHPPGHYRELVSGSAISRAAALVMAPKDDLPTTRARNDAVLRLAEDSGGFFFAVCSVHPADGEAALAEVDRVAAAPAANSAGALCSTTRAAPSAEVSRCAGRPVGVVGYGGPRRG